VGSRLLRLSFGNSIDGDALVHGGAHGVTRPTSYAPIVLAAGVMLTLWGAASSWIVSAAGLIVIGIGTARWIQDIRHEN
jgi:hypothetical protein